jgi:hypothetical protein
MRVEEEEGRGSKAGTGCALSCLPTCDSTRTTQWTGILGDQRPFKGARFFIENNIIVHVQGTPDGVYFLGMEFLTHESSMYVVFRPLKMIENKKGGVQHLRP